MSKSAFAERRGVAASAVSNWIARGKLSGAALTDDGRVVVDEAERQLGQTIDPGRGAPRLLEADALPLPPAPPAPASAPAPAAVDDAAATLAAIRLRKEQLSLEEAERRAALERGELARVDEMRRAWAAELEDLLAAVGQFIEELPVKLGCDRSAAETARREWREFRRRRSDQAQAHGD